jgi:hypothetical protein
VTITGAGAREPTLDGNGIDRGIETPAQQSITPYTVNITGVKITGGAGGAFSGGGLGHLARVTNLNPGKSTVSGNSADRGGIYNGYVSLSETTMTIRRPTVGGNRATSQGGGIENTADLTPENTTTSGNSE